MSVGICLITFDRPVYAMKSTKAIRKHLSDVVNHFVVVNDGSSAKYNGEYRRLEKTVQDMGGLYVARETNNGPATAKNTGIHYLMDEKKCDWIFTCEDDIIVQSPSAVTEYTRIAEETGLSHLSFAHHGPANSSGPVENIGDVDYFFHSVGAWCMFSRESLETHDLLDENFVRAWEHVEHELRLGVEPHRYPDIARSADYLTEIPGSIERSSIRPLSDWQSNIRDGLRYWQLEKPDTFNALFGAGMPLHAYANGIIGVQESR